MLAGLMLEVAILPLKVVKLGFVAAIVISSVVRQGLMTIR